MSRHLKEMDEKYFEHMLSSHRYALRLILAGIAVFIHGFIPDCFTTTASNTMRSIIEEINLRKQKKLEQ